MVGGGNNNIPNKMGDENLESLRRLNAKLFALETLNKEQEYE